MAWWRASPIDEKEALEERQPDISSKACSTSEWQSIMYTEGLATTPNNSKSEKVEKEISSSLHNHCMHVTVTKSEAVIVYNASYNNIMLFAIAVGKYVSISINLFIIMLQIWKCSL